MENLRIASFLVGMILALPVIIPAALVMRSLDQFRRRAAAKKIPCAVCGTTLGIEALDIADRAWRAHVSELFRLNPGIRFRLVRTVDAVCPACGAKYRFDEHARTFERVDEISI